MNVEARTELMSVLTELSQLWPEMRLGQLVAYLTDRADVPYRNAIPEIEDEEMLPAAREVLANARRRHAEQLLEQSRVAG